MKTIKLIFGVTLLMLNVFACSTDDQSENPIDDEPTVLEGQHLNYTIGDGPFVNFDDIILKEILLNNFNINTNLDNQISVEEALNFSGYIDVFSKNISSLVGIEKFENIIGLNCARNQISEISLINNTQLEFLNCSVNLFTEINLDKNVELQRLDISYTGITKLNLSKNSKLTRVSAQCNYELKVIDIKNGNNNGIHVFFVNINNYALQCIQVDDANYPETVSNWAKPEYTFYTENCSELGSIN